MSPISAAINEFLRTTMDPILKTEGFRKNRRRYRNIFDGRAESVLVEASSWNQGIVGQFTVTLSVVIPSLALRLYGLTVEPATARGSESGIITVLGHLMPGRRQDAWKIALHSDNCDEAERFRAAIEDFALPWFRKARTEEGLIEILENDTSLSALEVLTILYSDRNQPDRARAMASEILRRRPDLRDRVQTLLR
jgi:hypothetical protein